MKNIFIISSLITLAFTNCKEIYNPQTDGTQSILVVDGLITTDTVSYNIKLSRAIPYSASTKSSPELGATVSITDSEGNLYTLDGDGKGNYRTDSTKFIGIPGKSYVLHIDTKDGNKYESSPQFMNKPSGLDSISGINTTQTYLIKDSYGDDNSTVENGVETFVDVSFNGNDSTAGCRFDVSLLVQYSIYVPNGPNPLQYYDWSIMNINTSIYITEKKFATSQTNVYKNQSIGFFPDDVTLYGLDDFGKSTPNSSMSLNNWVLFIRQYSLNNDSYNYYKKMNTQLTNQGGIFDPIGSQVNGNIKCISNSKEIVLGHFETSPKVIATYKVIINSFSNNVQYEKHNIDLDKIPSNGESLGIMPGFWIY